MSDLVILIIASLVGGVLSLAGGLLLISNRVKAKNILKYVVPFAAGALLAAAFLDILKEAAHAGYIESALTWTLVGIVLFLSLETALKWFHGHGKNHKVNRDSTIPLIIIGDTMHNFIDGIAIAAAFLIDIPTGIVVTLAVAAHEIPQEIGDFGLLIEKGMSKPNVIKANLISALATTLAAVSFYILGSHIDLPMSIMLGLIAGFFIYIAVSDIIPNIRSNSNQKLAGVQIVMLIVGVVIVSSATNFLHEFIEVETQAVEHSEDDHDH